MLLEIIRGDFFGLITFRGILSAIVAFIICILFGGKIIAYLSAKNIKERIEKNDSPKLDNILANKKNTPTMGGIFLVGAILISFGLTGNFGNPICWILIFVLVSLCLLGVYDDYLKLTGKSKKGIDLWSKLLLQVAIGLIAGYMAFFILKIRDPVPASILYFPMLSGLKIDLGNLYPFFVMLVIVSCSNAINITDGLDGLAVGCLAIASLSYAIIAYIAGRIDFTEYLGMPYVRTSAEVTVFCTTIVGACLGFLWFNCYPAQVFMGDSGALSLGGALGLVACITKQEMLIFLVGGVFVIEILSTLIQIISFRLFHRKVFLIAPLHHHYQFKNIPEPKITQRFWILAIILAVASLATLKLK
jgi:phospho-N-acetylmuramoyl-pentapeptide-transferase